MLLVSAALLDNVLDNTDTQAQIAEEGAIEPLVVTVLSQYCLSIQLVLVLLGGMCGFVITVGTWHQLVNWSRRVNRSTGRAPCGRDTCQAQCSRNSHPRWQ